VTSTSSTIRFAWWKSTARGTPVTGYTLAIRRQTATGWTSWRRTQVGPDVLSFRWTGLPSGRTYEMTVRARSDVGPSSWGKYRSIATRR
jgi:hypothetical protein